MPVARVLSSLPEDQLSHLRTLELPLGCGHKWLFLLDGVGARVWVGSKPLANSRLRIYLLTSLMQFPPSAFVTGTNWDALACF